MVSHVTLLFIIPWQNGLMNAKLWNEEQKTCSYKRNLKVILQDNKYYPNEQVNLTAMNEKGQH